MPGRIALLTPAETAVRQAQPLTYDGVGRTRTRPPHGFRNFSSTRRAAGGALDFTVSAFSRPATLPARLGGPATRAVQRAMTGRYLTALDG